MSDLLLASCSMRGLKRSQNSFHCNMSPEKDGSSRHRHERLVSIIGIEEVECSDTTEPARLTALLISLSIRSLSSDPVSP